MSNTQEQMPTRLPVYELTHLPCSQTPTRADAAAMAASLHSHLPRSQTLPTTRSCGPSSPAPGSTFSIRPDSPSHDPCPETLACSPPVLPSQDLAQALAREVSAASKAS